MNDLLKEMGNRLASRRRTLNFTQDQVAEMAGVTTQTISSAERGTKALRPENIVKICNVLGISPNYLLLGSDSLLLEEVCSSGLSKLTPQQRHCLDEVVRLILVLLSQHE